MRGTLAFPHASREVRRVDHVGPDKLNPAKADLLSPTESDARTKKVDEVCWLTWLAMVDGHGSVKAFGLALDDTDGSQLRRQVTRGTITLEELAGADDAALAELGARLTDRFGASRKSPQQKAAEAVSEASLKLHEAMQLVLSLEGRK